MARAAIRGEPTGVRTAKIVSRLVVAGAGGYALASATAMALPLVLPLPRAQGVAVATLTAFAVFVLAIVWVYSVRGLTLAFGSVAGSAVILAGLGYALRGGGA